MVRVPFDRFSDYEKWREHGRDRIQQALGKGHRLLWITGNHLGVLPLYDALSAEADGALVIQLDAHLDIYNLSDCKTELSHGNFLLHCRPPLPGIINLGHRELLLPESHVKKYYRAAFSAADLAVDMGPAVAFVGQECSKARQVVLDIDCDVLDPAYFPAVSHPQPFGLTPQQVLRLLQAIGSSPLKSIAISEFDPGRDVNDRSLATLAWLLEYVLLRFHEPASR
jgi:agmatinase